jgi:DNA-binding transcriptional MerR regulator
VDKAPDAFRTISEVADELDLPQHVLRFWETRFSQIRPMKRGGGRRYYRPDDVDLLRGIRHLLYGEGYTIRGVQRILKDHGIKFVQSVWQAGAPQPAKAAGDVEETEAGKTARSRRLFGLLPSLQGEDENAGSGSLADERHEPPIEDVTADAQDDADEEDEDADDAPADLPAVPLQPRPAIPSAKATPAAPVQPAGRAGAKLLSDDIRKLQATLTDLTECRRLLDAALANEN